MKIRSVCVVGLSVLALCVATTGLARAASAGSPPPLPAPTGTVVRVSTESQLQNAVKSAGSGTTILISPGTYNLSSSLYLNGVNDVTLRGATDNRDDVVLVGQGMDNSNFGSVESGVWTNGRRNTIANLTIRDVWEHCIALNDGAAAPHIYNVHLINAGTQFIKASSGSGINDGVVEYSIIEYASTARSDYTNGVDVHIGKNWVVRNNLFRNITAPDGALAGPAILFWNSTGNATVEGNTFIDSQREISMGLIERTPDDNSGGVVRNNFIYRRAGLPGDVAILVADSPNTQVVHNTILLNGSYPNAIEYRFSGSAGVVIANNLVSGQIRARDGATASVTANYLSANAAMFVNAAAGDLHLVAGATAVIDRVAVLSAAPTDWDGESRPQGSGADYGADEFASASAPPPPSSPPGNQPPSVSLTAPASGSGFTAPASITLRASASDSDGAVSQVSFYAGSTQLGSSTSSPYSFGWSGVPVGTYTLTAVAVDDDGASTTSAPVTVTVSSGGSGLPAPWTTADLGSPALQGSASYASGGFTITAGGVDIWGTSDEFRFVYRPMIGDGEVVARVTSVENSNGWAKAGLMIREDLTAYSAHAMTVVTPAEGVNFQRRRTSGTESFSDFSADGIAPQWVKLVRSGSTFSGFQSVDGVSWAFIGSDTVAMPAAAYVGLAVTSHDASRRTTATLDNFTISQSTSSQAPIVALTSPVDDAVYMAGATVTLNASATVPGGSVARVEFYRDSTLIGSDTTSPYSYSWDDVAAGNYSITARAYGQDGRAATSNAVWLTVVAAGASKATLQFTPSPDHATNVTGYTLDLFTAGSDPTTAQPAGSGDVGKPAIANSTISVDVTSILAALPSGSYIATVTANGPGGHTRSAPSPPVVR